MADVHLLDRWRAEAEADADRLMYSFVGPGGPAGSRTCGGAWSAAGERAQALRTQWQVGDRVALLHRPGLAFIDDFLGCLRAGLVPVPLPPPTDPVGFARILQTADAVGVLVGPALLESRGLQRIWDALENPPPRFDSRSMSGVGPLPSHRGGLAFLQFTSGSTRAPRGVRVTWENLAHQLANNRVELHFDRACTSVTWVPHYHDFALISGILSMLAGHGHLVLIDPTAFLRNPAVWGDTIHHHAATHTWAPDFGYALFTQRTTPEERAGWDFSHLRVCMTAAEPIRPRTVDGFQAAFAVTGLPDSAFCPAYGLAEHTVAVSVFGRQRVHFDRTALEAGRLVEGQGVELFGCGPPGPGVRVRIVVEGKDRAPGEIGEIWVDSPSRSPGYLGEDGSFEGGWLRTGDLGALFQGELFVTGRAKDRIVIRGRNLAPHDVEDVAQEIEGVKPGRVVAFGVEEGGEERLIVVVECDEGATDVPARVAGAVQQALQVRPHSVEVWPRGRIEKTTSGKLRRGRCRELWRAGAR